MDILDDQRLQLWGGLECTLNRVGNTFHDQLERSGHHRRVEDLDRIAELGVRVLRYPALWEWVSSGAQPGRYEWSLIDNKFERLRKLQLEPIVGFVHHGSGPPGVDLLDGNFALGLEQYAEAFASRFPWVEAYTPVNEPLTTARFSALYGHWYPHKRDDHSFALTILNQCRAISLAMRAIHKVNSVAKLVQTEDLGKTFASPSMQYQADFENHRRWLTYDLLCGKVDRHHPIGDYFNWIGIPESQVNWFSEHPLSPDIIGINYYVTSERYLDRRYHRYPSCCRGGNSREIYADVEAVRVRRTGLLGINKILKEAWKRYRRPLAVTEAHLGCTREEQLRWLSEIWTEGRKARGTGVDLRAITAWSLMGSYDWNSLLTRADGYYEPGAFDVRGAVPRRTAIATLISELASNSRPSHPVLAGDGWWRRDERLLYRTCPGSEQTKLKGSPILLITNGDALGDSIKASCHARGLVVISCKRSSCDFSNPRLVDDLLVRMDPWAVVYTTQSREDAFQRRPRSTDRQCIVESATLARFCRRVRLPFLAFSSSLVFGAERDHPYHESDRPNPICESGRRTVQTELSILEHAPGALVIRPGAYLDVSARNGFLRRSVLALAKGVPCCFPSITMSLTYLPEVVNTGLDLLIDGDSGIWHLAGEGAATWNDVANELAVKLRPHEPRFFQATNPEHLVVAKPKQVYRALASEKGISLSSWKVAIARYLDDGQRLYTAR